MPRAPKDKPPKRCKNWGECGNDLPDPRATWCPACGAERRPRQQQKRNRRHREAAHDPERVVLHADEAGLLRDALRLLAQGWNAYQAAGPAGEPAARERLHEVLEGVLVELWADLPPRLLPQDAADG